MNGYVLLALQLGAILLVAMVLAFWIGWALSKRRALRRTAAEVTPSPARPAAIPNAQPEAALPSNPAPAPLAQPDTRAEAPAGVVSPSAPAGVESPVEPHLPPKPSEDDTAVLKLAKAPEPSAGLVAEQPDDLDEAALAETNVIPRINPDTAPPASSSDPLPEPADDEQPGEVPEPVAPVPLAEPIEAIEPQELTDTVPPAETEMSHTTADAEAQLAETEAQLAAAEERVREAESVAEAAVQRAEAAETRLGEAEQRLLEANERAEATEREAQERIAASEHEVEAARERIAGLQEQVAKQELDMARLETRATTAWDTTMPQLFNRIESLEGEMAKARDEAAELEALLAIERERTASLLPATPQGPETEATDGLELHEDFQAPAPGGDDYDADETTVFERVVIEQPFPEFAAAQPDEPPAEDAEAPGEEETPEAGLDDEAPKVVADLDAAQSTVAEETTTDDTPDDEAPDEEPENLGKAEPTAEEPEEDAAEDAQEPMAPEPEEAEAPGQADQPEATDEHTKADVAPPTEAASSDESAAPDARAEDADSESADAAPAPEASDAWEPEVPEEPVADEPAESQSKLDSAAAVALAAGAGLALGEAHDAASEEPEVSAEEPDGDQETTADGPEQATADEAKELTAEEAVAQEDAPEPETERPEEAAQYDKAEATSSEDGVETIDEPETPEAQDEDAEAEVATETTEESDKTQDELPIDLTADTAEPEAVPDIDLEATLDPETTLEEEATLEEAAEASSEVEPTHSGPTEDTVAETEETPLAAVADQADHETTIEFDMPLVAEADEDTEPGDADQAEDEDDEPSLRDEPGSQDESADPAEPAAQAVDDSGEESLSGHPEQAVEVEDIEDVADFIVAPPGHDPEAQLTPEQTPEGQLDEPALAPLQWQVPEPEPTELKIKITWPDSASSAHWLDQHSPTAHDPAEASATPETGASQPEHVEDTGDEAHPPSSGGDPRAATGLVAAPGQQEPEPSAPGQASRPKTGEPHWLAPEATIPETPWATDSETTLVGQVWRVQQPVPFPPVGQTPESVSTPADWDAFGSTAQLDEFTGSIPVIPSDGPLSSMEAEYGHVHGEHFAEERDPRLIYDEPSPKPARQVDYLNDDTRFDDE